MPADKGLLEVLLLSEPAANNASLTTVWASHEFHAVHRDWLLQELGLPVVPESTGFLKDARHPSKPWWKKLRPYPVAMGLLGLFGSLELARDRYGLFFGLPDLDVRARPSETINMIALTPRPIQIAVVNHDRYVTGTLRRLRAEVFGDAVAEGGYVGAAVPPRAIGPVDPGKESAEALTIGALPSAGRYRLVVAFERKGGVFRPAASGELEVPIRVWKGITIGAPQTPRPSRHDWVAVPIAVGDHFPAGLVCSGEILRVPGASFTGVTSRTLGVTESANGTDETVGDEVAFIEFRTTPAGPFQDASFQLGIRRGKDDWSELLSRLTVKCFRKSEADNAR